MKDKTLFAFLPYIRTRRRCVIRGIEFRSITDLDGLDADNRRHVESLGQMFFTSQGGRIADPTFALILESDYHSANEATRLLTEAQLLITYLYSAPHPSPTADDDVFLDAECVTLHTFSQAQVVSSLVTTTKCDVMHGRVAVDHAEALPASEFIDGYNGYRNRVVQFCVAEGSRVYPEIPHICLNHSQCLEADLRRFLDAPKNWPFRFLFGRHDMSGDNQNRVFTSLLWHSHSCRSGADHSERLLYLAIALETLLALDKGERLTERFKDAVTTLIGPVPRLDNWLDQFYTARSTTVHQGRPAQLWFAAPVPNTKKETIPHRALIMYGRRIFRICMAAVLTGIVVTEDSHIATLLIHNDERLREVCKLLADENVTAHDRLISVRSQVEELHQCETISFSPRLEEDLDVLFGAARLALKVYRECKQIEDPELEAYLNAACSADKTNGAITFYDALKKTADQLLKFVYHERKGPTVDQVALRLFEFASRPAVALEIHLRGVKE